MLDSAFPCEEIFVHCMDVLRELIAFDTWANRRVHATLTAHPGHDRATRVFDHLLAAQQLWLERVGQPEQAGTDTWPGSDPSSFELRLEENHRSLVALLDRASEEALEAPVTYHDTAGVTHDTPLREILMHLTHHGTHHRAQVGALLRQSGVELPRLDFIVFVRERRGERT